MNSKSSDPSQRHRFVTIIFLCTRNVLRCISSLSAQFLESTTNHWNGSVRHWIKGYLFIDFTGLSRSMTYHTRTSRWFAWWERAKTAEIVAARERTGTQKTPTELASLVDENQSILETNILTFMIRRGSWWLCCYAQHTHPIRMLGHRATIHGFFYRTSRYAMCMSSRYWPLIESHDGIHFRKCIFWVTLVERNPSLIATTLVQLRACPSDEPPHHRSFARDRKGMILLFTPARLRRLEVPRQSSIEN